MLRLARQRLGFTQKDAADRLGIVQPVLSRFENGLSDPDDAFLIKASCIYDVPRAFFDIREPVYGPPVSVHPMARAKAEVTARDLDMVTAELNIRVMQMRRFLESIDFEPQSRLPQLDVEQFGSPEKAAQVVRSHWGLPSGPVRNLTGLVETAGVIVGFSDFGGAAVSGMTFRVPGLPPLVLLNEHHPSDRMRFTLAHELGHIILHRFPTATMEEEANEFASSILMPTHEIRAAFQGRKVTLELLAALKPEWKVAMQALLMRAKTLNIIDYNQARYLWQQLSSRGWRLSEPAELNFPREEPTVIRSIIRSHIEHMGYSLDDLCSLIPIHKHHFTKMYGSVDDTKPIARPKFRIVS
jgi:Zn-dependent peptidase ImmA (M78 family)/transcriptional regulator with XRE-family HTH domain